MNDLRTKRIKKIILGQSLVITLILLISAYLITYAMGYRLDLNSRKILKTGIIVVSSNPKPDQILLNGVPQAVRSDIAFTLEPGKYELTISKEGYHTWQALSEVKEELVNYYKYIELFMENTSLQTLTDNKKIELLNAPDNILAASQPKGLSSNGYEIWINNDLITRFSQPISNLTWYGDNHHLIYQKLDAICIIEDTGTNETVLVRLPSAENAKFALGNKNSELYIYQNGKYFWTEIQ